MAYPHGTVHGMSGSFYVSSLTQNSQPWYGQAVARCLVSEYLLKYFPYEDFHIYEIGAGNGTLAKDILDHLQADYPEVYQQTHYTIIEISSALAKLQTQRLKEAHPCVEVKNESIFHWNIRQPAPCFFIAMEVIVSTSQFLSVSFSNLSRITLAMTLSVMTLRTTWSLTKASSPWMIPEILIHTIPRFQIL